MCELIRRAENSPNVPSLLKMLGMQSCVLEAGNWKPKESINGVLIQEDGDYKMVDAIWWYALKKAHPSWVPNTSTASYNINQPKKNLYKSALQTRRAIIFADAVVYSEDGQQHLIENKNGLVLAALYRRWETKSGAIYSFGVLTGSFYTDELNYSGCSMPVLIPRDEELVQGWLNDSADNNYVIETVLENVHFDEGFHIKGKY